MHFSLLVTVKKNSKSLLWILAGGTVQQGSIGTVSGGSQTTWIQISGTKSLWA